MIRYQPQATTPPALPAESCSTSLTARMAEQMREMAFAGETVSVETLTQRGWTALTIKRLAADATAQARRQSVRRVER